MKCERQYLFNLTGAELHGHFQLDSEMDDDTVEH